MCDKHRNWETFTIKYHCRDIQIEDEFSCNLYVASSKNISLSLLVNLLKTDLSSQIIWATLHWVCMNDGRMKGNIAGMFDGWSWLKAVMIIFPVCPLPVVFSPDSCFFGITSLIPYHFGVFSPFGHSPTLQINIQPTEYGQARQIDVMFPCYSRLFLRFWPNPFRLVTEVPVRISSWSSGIGLPASGIMNLRNRAQETALLDNWQKCVRSNTEVFRWNHMSTHRVATCS